MHHLPHDTATRELFSVEHDLVPIGTGERQPLTFREAMRSAQRTMQDNDAIRAVHCICMRGNDDIVLARFGPRGGIRCLWNFTKGERGF